MGQRKPRLRPNALKKSPAETGLSRTFFLEEAVFWGSELLEESELTLLVLLDMDLGEF